MNLALGIDFSDAFYFVMISHKHHSVEIPCMAKTTFTEYVIRIYGKKTQVAGLLVCPTTVIKSIEVMHSLHFMPQLDCRCRMNRDVGY